MGENPPAFPEVPGDFNAYEGRQGMTLRDWFAGQALAGFTVATNSNIEPGRYARACYALADAMLAARKETPDGL